MFVFVMCILYVALKKQEEAGLNVKTQSVYLDMQVLRYLHGKSPCNYGSEVLHWLLRSFPFILPC